MHEVGEAAINCGLGYMNPILYRGYYYDFTLGMYHLITRYYDPETGRFTSADTVDYLAPDVINGLNLYAYCGNNPVMNVDPTGHAWWDWVVAVAVVVVCAVAAVATAGTSLVAGAALAGAAVGGGLSVATQAVDVAQNGGDFSWGQFAADTAIGALSGVAGAGLTSALPHTGLLATTAGTIVGGAVSATGVATVLGTGLVMMAKGAGPRMGHNQHEKQMWKEAKRKRNITDKDLATRIHQKLKQYPYSETLDDLLATIDEILASFGK